MHRSSALLACAFAGVSAAGCISTPAPTPPATEVAQVSVQPGAAMTSVPGSGVEPTGVQGISINDLRKNLRALNEQMDQECASSAARYGIRLDAALITSIDPPPDAREGGANWGPWLLEPSARGVGFLRVERADCL